jgi:geranylgeranyl diphosphate synthase type II
MEVATGSQKEEIKKLLASNDDDKVSRMLSIFKSCGVDGWAKELKEKYIDVAFKHLEDIAVLSARKKPLKELAGFLVQREY